MGIAYFQLSDKTIAKGVIVGVGYREDYIILMVEYNGKTFLLKAEETFNINWR